ncbi:MAG TPA: 1-acyl-sn-glycerol-3-phosphate acyltransferase [Dehalococcoidia bacterium]|nr:1-acyl-sn-glycerol-3-phosphate acyltransferase [Dehalococcoidia bacterium]
MAILYKTAVTLQKLLLNIFADWEVTGGENVPPGGPLIVASNHLSQCDPSYITIAVKRHVRFLAKRELFAHPIASPLLYAYGAHPLNRSNVDVNAYKWAINLLTTDGTLALFPEGTRSPKGLRKARTGIVKLALLTGAPILPLAITGTENFGNWARGVFVPTAKIRVTVGTPFSLPVIEGRISNAVAESLLNTIMERIAFLLPPKYRGVYQIPTGNRDKNAR